MRRKIYIILGWIFAWQVLSWLVNNPILLAGPLETGKALLDNIVMPSFWKTVSYSLLRIATGFFAGVGVGLLVLVCASARFPIIEEIFSPVLSLIKAVPVASFVVLFLIWWHSDMLSTAISFWCGAAQYLYQYSGGHFAAPITDFWKWHRIQMVSLTEHFSIYRPALKPFLTAVSESLVGLGWKSGRAAEVIGTPAFSIGERLYMSEIYLETADVLASTAVTIALSVLSDKVLLWAWERFCKWEPDCRGAGMSDLSCKPQQKALRLEHVCKSYGVQQILNDFCAAYDRGSTTYFTTPSGSGKTTLFRMIAGLEKPDAGDRSCGGRRGRWYSGKTGCVKNTVL